MSSTSTSSSSSSSTAITAATTTAAATAAAAAAVLLSSLTTYYMTKRWMTQKEERKRHEAWLALQEEKKLLQQEKQKQQGEHNNIPKGILQEDIHIDNVYLWQVEHLGTRFPSNFDSHKTNVMAAKAKSKGSTTSYNKLIQDDVILAQVVQKPIPKDSSSSPKKDEESKSSKSSSSKSKSSKSSSVAYVRAGPRKVLHFDPATVNAAIVTCGGLCPGLNNVVREITNALHDLYGIGGTIYGIRGGYKGFYDPSLLPPLTLTKAAVENIHHSGGTILSSSRGGFDVNKILQFLRSHKIHQLYVIGGDGTHRGAFTVHETCLARGMNVSVAGIPKTIDNDVDHIDRSFGFASAVEASLKAIRSAKVEATCNLPNGIGIVKLMGRSAGFIAVHATIASGDVDLCLVPEIPILLEGPYGCLPHLRQVVQRKGFAVVVVAEGAGEELFTSTTSTTTEVDASGNKKLPKIGEFMKQAISSYFQEKHGEEATVKYIDPSYMIRSIPANATDALYCYQLAQNAVHGAMAGYTGFSVGLCNNKMCLLPIPELVATSPRTLNPRGRTWERVLGLTGQPNPPLDSLDDSNAAANDASSENGATMLR